VERVIGLAGRRGSGKTTVARGLAACGFKPTSFGDVVRRETAALGLPVTTPHLQRAGNDLIEKWGWRRFCDEVLQTVQDSPLVVVDGFRHAAPVLLFRERFAERFKFVFLDVDEEVRRARLREREGFDPQRDQHPVELEVDDLRRLADSIVLSDDNAVPCILNGLVSPTEERSR
jgi:dephospho-CoA kinase